MIIQANEESLRSEILWSNRTGKINLDYGAKKYLGEKAYSDFDYFQADGADGEYVENLNPNSQNELSATIKMSQQVRILIPSL